MNVTLPIDADVPLPKLRPQKRQTGDIVSQTIDALDVGHSFIMPDFKDRALSSRLLGAAARNQAKYTYRRVPKTDNARVWRVS